jgi:Xaa-Pro aminopeptidase
MPFAQDEMIERRKRAQQLMEREKLDAIIVSGDFSACMNYYYLSGHAPRDYQSNFSRPHLMVLKQDGRASLLVYNVNKENALEESWVKDVRAYGPPFKSEALKDLLVDMKLEQATIGMELGADQRLWFPVLEFLALREAMPQARFVDAAAVLWQLRMIKSPAEVDRIRRAGLINCRALRRTFAELSDGCTEKDITRLVCKYLVDEGAWRPPHTQIQVVTGAKARRKGHRSRMQGPTDDALRKGDVLFIDSGAVFDNYWGEFNRMAVVGEPTARQADCHRKIRTVVKRSIEEAFRPGNSYRHIIEHMVGIYKELGLGEDQYGKYIRAPFFHLAHGVGLNGSEPPFVRMDDESVLEPGMVVNVEAYLLDEGITYGSEEDIHITATGAEVLTPWDEGLFKII